MFTIKATTGILTGIAIGNTRLTYLSIVSISSSWTGIDTLAIVLIEVTIKGLASETRGSRRTSGTLDRTRLTRVRDYIIIIVIHCTLSVCSIISNTSSYVLVKYETRLTGVAERLIRSTCETVVSTES